MTQRALVLPAVAPLTEEDAREILAPVLLRLCSEHGPKRVALQAGGVDEKTIRNARDEKSTLRLETAANLLPLDGMALDGFLARVGRRSVPSSASCSSDVLPALTGTVHKLVVATSSHSPDGAGLSRCEIMGAEAELRQAFDALGSLLSRIDAWKTGEAA